MSRDARLAFLLLLPATVFLVGFYLYPTVQNIQVSFTDLSLLKLREGGDWVGFANYWRLVESSEFYRVLFNTAFWLTLVSVGLRIVLGIALAMLLNAVLLERLKLKTASRLVMLVPWATPPVVAVIIWRWLLDPTFGPINDMLLSLGLISQPIAFFADTAFVWPAIVLIIVWNTLPLVTLTFLASLQSLPRELLEAASVDGADAWQRFRHVILPHLMPTVLIMSMLLTFWTFNNFVYVWLATGAGPGRYSNVLATEVYLRAFVDFELGYSSAIGVVMALLMGLLGWVYFDRAARREFRDALA